RYAIVGVGHIAQVAVIPAFAHARNSALTALVSDDPVKLRTLGRRHGIPGLYSYDQYEECLGSGEVDAVYIALPNSMHREYTERAARAGVHVLCEKPLAVTARDCEAMIRATDKAGVKLMVAYRLHFEEANLEAVRLARDGTLGDVRTFDSTFTMDVVEGNIRLKADLGGGPLWDIGIYCINAARYLFRAEPEEVFAWSANNGERRFREVDEMTSAVLRFPGERLATFTCSFGAADVSSYRVVGTKGDLRVEPAYEYVGPLAHALTVEGKKKERTFARRDQFAPELLHFSDCVLRGRDPQPGGREGLADVRVIEALLRSARTGRPVRLGRFEAPTRPTLRKEKRRPPVKKPKLVRAESASGD
ncbi:MAG TPA: Gfo/Idh/MocA family oxidoreductase, partial [Vicinamibacteria bacterium]|nr:Gfo/Idh/MocA family oxidoreductase [Vicinamibacteria bacterium]